MDDETGQRIRVLLSLNPDAADAAVIDAVTNLQATLVRLATNPAPAQIPAPDETSLNSLSGSSHAVNTMALERLAVTEAELHSSRSRRLVEDACRAGKVTPAMRPWAIAACSADPENFTALMSVMPVIVESGENPIFASLERQSSQAGVPVDVLRNLNLTPKR